MDNYVRVGDTVVVEAIENEPVTEILFDDLRFKVVNFGLLKRRNFGLGFVAKRPCLVSKYVGNA